MTKLIPIADLDVFVATRHSLHQFAEHVLAKARFVEDGSVELTATAGGFATPMLAGGRRVRLDGGAVVVDDGSSSRHTELTTIAAAAAFVGIEPGFPSELYAASTPLEPSAALPLDLRSAESLSAWFALTADVLAQFAGEIVDAQPSPLVLWPEHFDQAFFTTEANESQCANYGASPGDAGHPEPYLYVGPWSPVAKHEFWNAAHFNGAVLPLSALAGSADEAEAALQFLRTGRALLVA